MDDDVLGALDRLEGAADDVLARLRQHLDGDVVGDEILFDEGAKEGILRLARGGEAHLDLLEADSEEQFEKVELGLQRHGLDEGLVAVAKIDAAPDGRLFDHVLFRPIHAALGRQDELFAILVALHELPPHLQYKIRPRLLTRKRRGTRAVPLLLRADARRSRDTTVSPPGNGGIRSALLCFGQTARRRVRPSPLPPRTVRRLSESRKKGVLLRVFALYLFYHIMKIRKKQAFFGIFCKRCPFRKGERHLFAAHAAQTPETSSSHSSQEKPSGRERGAGTPSISHTRPQMRQRAWAWGEVLKS